MIGLLDQANRSSQVTRINSFISLVTMVLMPSSKPTDKRYRNVLFGLFRSESTPELDRPVYRRRGSTDSSITSVSDSTSRSDQQNAATSCSRLAPPPLAASAVQDCQFVGRAIPPGVQFNSTVFSSKSVSNLTLTPGNANVGGDVNPHRRHKEDRGGGGGGAGYESRGRSWSRIFERDGHHAHGNPSGKHQGTSFFANYGRSMPLLPTTASQCNLTDDSLSCTNLSAGLTGFPELPAKVTFTRHHKNRMNHELSFAIASAKSKVNLAEIHESLSREGALPLPEDEDSPYVDHPYEVVVDIQTPL